MSSHDNSLEGDLFTRNASAFFEKFERYDCQELLANASTHWMMSTEDFKYPTELPSGLISQMPNLSDSNVFCLFPVEEGIEQLDLREVHQIVRELSVGIYVLNQLPSIALEANFDQSTSIQLPPAYQDTRVGNLLCNVDYMMKALWHGVYFPDEKRQKFSERWRGSLDVNALGKPETKKEIITEFVSNGMIDITKDKDYAAIYDNMPVEQPGDTDMAEEKRFFMTHVNDIIMRMVLSQNSIKLSKNLFVIEPNWEITSVAHLLEDKIDKTGYERLNARLQLHEIMLKSHLCNKPEIQKMVYLLKLVSFLVPLFVAMRKRMKIPEIVTKLLPRMSGDDVKTEREFPPLMLSADFKCKNFNFGNRFFHLHGGIVIDHETPEHEDVAESIMDAYEKIKYEATSNLMRWLDPTAPLQETYPASIMEIDGKKYFVFSIDFETYYPQNPQKPRWIHNMCEEMSKLRPKRIPIPESQIHEQFKKYFGYKKAIKFKNPFQGLKAAAQRGLTAMFLSLHRKCPGSRLSKQDEVGLSLVHYAAMYNRPNILAILVLQSMDINVRRNNNFLSQEIIPDTTYDPSSMATEEEEDEDRTGPTPMHLAARCGALDAVSCLLAINATPMITDQDGWLPIHHAAYYDHEAVIRLLWKKDQNMIEYPTRNDIQTTPLLLAASSGALSALKCLIDLGTYIQRKDGESNNVIHLAALRFHTNILEFFIRWNHPEVRVWEILVGMLKSEEIQRKDAAVKCLEVMSTSDNEHWKSILNAGGISALVELLEVDNEEIQSVTASVLCNISENDPVRRALTEANAGPILIQLLSSPMDEIQSRAAIILSDLACVDDNQEGIAQQGGIPALINLLESELEDVLVNAVNAIRVMCTNNPENQTAVARNGGLEPLVEFLGDHVNSDILQAASAAALASLADNHRANQDAIVNEGAVKPIVQLIRGHNITVQVKAAGAMESLAMNNATSQKAFLDLDAPKALLRLLKMFSMEVKEQAACGLWALAGQTKMQQKYIAERIGIPQLIEILLKDSEKLQFVGCLGMTALGCEDIESQNRIAGQGGIQPLVRLLRSHKTSERVLSAVIQSLGTLCLGLAHKNNKVTQHKMAEDHAIPLLVQLLVAPPSQEIQVEVAYALGCVVLGNSENQEKLKEDSAFKYEILFEMIQESSDRIRLRAGFALAIFAFNNTPAQYAIREAGGIEFHYFEDFLESEDEFNICYAAFQIVVLARVIVDMDQVSITAKGVTALVNILKSGDDNAIILAGSLMSSLAHTRAGIPEAMVTVRAIDLLLDRLHSSHDQVRFHCAVALGYLSFNRTAARLMLTACRNTPGLYDRLEKNIGKNPRICKDFTEEYRRAKIVGLPCLSLEINGGPPVDPHKSSKRRPHTSMPGKRSKPLPVPDRSISAPVKLRAQSAGPVRLKRLTPDESIKSSKVSLAVTEASRPGTGKKEDLSFLKTQLGAWK